MKETTRTYVSILVLGLVLAGALVYFHVQGRRARTVELSSAIPQDAQVLLLANVRSIRGTSYAHLLAQNAMPSVGSSNDPCTNDMWSRVDTLALWQPARADADFAMAAHVEMSTDTFWSCAKQIVSDRGGTAALDKTDGFFTVSDPALGADAAQIAFRNDGLLLIGKRATRLSMIDMLQQRTPSSNTGWHQLMRRQLSEQLPGATDLVATVIVTPALRSKIAQWIGETTSLLDDVTAIAIAAQLGATTTVLANVTCQSAGACMQLGQRLEVLRTQATKSIAMRLIGASALLQEAKLSTENTRLSVLISAPDKQILALVARLSAYQGEAARVRAPRSLPAQQPDEKLRPQPEKKNNQQQNQHPNGGIRNPEAK